MIKRSPSSRLLNGIKCKVCQDCSSGKHYGIYSCDGCAGFFKRSIRRARNYVCKGKNGATGQCLMDKTHRNHCRHCRLKKCQEAGMNKDAVQHERGPRNSTRQRNAAMAVSRDLWGNRPISPSMFSARFPLPSPEAANYFACRPLQLREPLISFATQLSPTLSHSLAHMRFMRMNSSTPILQPMPQYHPHTAFASTSAAVNSPPPRVEPEASAAELAARVMLLNGEWLKGIQEFSSLPMADQLILLEEATTELFLLTAAQYNLPATDEFLREAAGLNGETHTSSEQESAIQNIITIYQRIISQIRELNLDTYEYHYLKLIVFFKKDTPGVSPPRIKDLAESGAIAAVHDHVQVLLLRHFELYYPTQHLRVVRLHQLPTCLRTITGLEIRKLFFSKTVGLADLEKIFVQIVRLA